MRFPVNAKKRRMQICDYRPLRAPAVFGETNETVNKKVVAAFKNELIPIMCVGENLNEREKGITFDIIRQQLEAGLKDISPEDAQKLILAYEPVWAIGTGKVATPEQAQEAHKFIRDWLTKKYGANISGVIRINMAARSSRIISPV